MPENLTHSQLTKLVYDLIARIDKLEQENIALKEELAIYKNPKNSSNSSVPPSKDENRIKKNRSLRKKSLRKPGGQNGHKGLTLRMSEKPDLVQILSPCFCNKCGETLIDIEGDFVGSRQVIDIPPIKPIVTEYQVYSKHCSCGHKTTGSYPAGIEAPISYGSGIQSMVAYLHARQFVPFLRMKELLNDLFGLPISEGGIDQLLTRFERKSQPIYQKLIKSVESSPVVGSDETGCSVDGKKYWFWAWQTPKLTLIHASDNRAKKTVDEVFPKGFPLSYLVSDCWQPQLNTLSKNQQICIAHLLRDTEYLIQLYQHDWPKAFQCLLLDAIKVKDGMQEQDYQNLFHKGRSDIMLRFESLLAENIESERHEKLGTFAKRITKLKQNVFVFLFAPDVPPDNNASERAIRNVKVKLKVSGQFKSVNGARRFAVIRSIIDTVIKTKNNVWATLKLIAEADFQYY
jgi:transposase